MAARRLNDSKWPWQSANYKGCTRVMGLQAIEGEIWSSEPVLHNSEKGDGSRDLSPFNYPI